MLGPPAGPGAPVVGVPPAGAAPSSTSDGTTTPFFWDRGGTGSAPGAAADGGWAGGAGEVAAHDDRVNTTNRAALADPIADAMGRKPKVHLCPGKTRWRQPNVSPFHPQR